MSDSPETNSYGAAPSGGQDSLLPRRAIHLGDYVRVVHKRRWTILPVFLLIVVATAVNTFTTTPVYQAQATILIQPENPNVVNIQEVVQEKGGVDYYQTQWGILRSRALAARVVNELGLAEPNAYGPAASEFSLGRLIRSPIRTVRNLVSPPPPPRDENSRQSAAISAFLSRLTVVSTRGNRLVDLQFRSTDPVIAAKAVNALAAAYIDQNLEFRLSSSKEASTWLLRQLGDQRKEVEAAEQALQGYRELNNSVSLDGGQNIVNQKLQDLNGAVTRAKTVRIEKEALYNQLQTLQAERSIDSFPAILADAFIQRLKAEISDLQRQRTQLSQTFLDKHPEMQKIDSAIASTDARLQAEINKVVEAVRNQYQSAQAQERELMVALDAQTREAQGLNRSGIQYGVLQRDAESNRQIYQTLLQRAKETGVSAELRTNNVRVVDPAEAPTSPILPRTRLNLSLAVFGGALFALALGLVFEYFDNRIKGPDEIRQHLGLPFLGLIPSVSISGEERADKLLTHAVPPVFAEAFRTVRTNILFSSAEEGTRSVLVTSSVPHEGKTIVACNLAIGLAQAGSRVLLIDADMRIPKISNLFDLPVEPGLSNLLVGEAKAADAIRKTTVSGLWVLGGGRMPPNPAELLGAPKLSEFLTALKEHFDWIIIDSPPVMPVTDASIIAHISTGVLFVVGAEMTSHSVARNAIERLTAARAKFYGAVLNKADVERNSYYYAEYYRRDYAKYYVAS